MVNAPIRDSEAMSKMALGVKALATHPLKSNKNAADQGQTQVEVDMQVGLVASHAKYFLLG